MTDTKTKVIAGATIVMCAVIAALNCFTAYLQWRAMQPLEEVCPTNAELQRSTVFDERDYIEDAFIPHEAAQ